MREHIIYVLAIRTVKLSNNIFLLNVMYAPHFHSFFIQELHHCKKIGWDAILDGLYVLSFTHHIDGHFTHCNALHTISSFHLPSVNVLTITILWHTRFGHTFDKILRMISNKIHFSMSHGFYSSLCQMCPLAKFRILLFPSQNHIANFSFDVLHCEICGPYGHPTYDGNKYYFTLVDMIHLGISYQTQLFFTLPHSVHFAFTEEGIGIAVSQQKQLLTLSHSLPWSRLNSNQGTLHQFSCVERPEQNLTVERKHQHLLNVARAFQKCQFPFGECVAIAAFIINRLSSPILEDKSPFLLLHGLELDYTFMMSFEYTFSLVAKLTSVSIMLTVAAAK
ncbi:hypothetical protein CR513_29161, partial [Mucuna pruriens]